MSQFSPFNQDWNILIGEGTFFSIEKASLAVLIDIRGELREINATLKTLRNDHAANQSTLWLIARNTKPKTKAKTKTKPKAKAKKKPGGKLK